MAWSDIFTQWEAVALDLHTIFGIDTESDVLDARTWPWLEARILDLLAQPSRLRKALALPDNLTP